MTPFRGATATIIQINMQFLVATLLALTAIWVWPQELIWWRMGVISIASMLAALSLFFQALKSIVALHRREKVMKEFLARGKSPKSAKLADDETLKQAGMV